MTLLIFRINYSHFLQVEASNPASAFPINDRSDHESEIVNQTLVLHLELQRFEFTKQHYAMVAYYFMDKYLVWFKKYVGTIR